jgi:hypothetical protein
MMKKKKKKTRRSEECFGKMVTETIHWLACAQKSGPALKEMNVYMDTARSIRV